MTAFQDASPPIAPLPEGWMGARQADAGLQAFGARVGALMSARSGGVSLAPFEQCNLGDHVGDDALAVAHNRERFARHAGARPVWMTQVHGNRVIRLTHDRAPSDADAFNPWLAGPAQPQADGAFTTEPGLVCTVMVADCLPVLLAAPEGRGVAALHAGWRGLAGAGDMQGEGIVHKGVRALCDATSADPGDLCAWLGPCIGPNHFEVGHDVLDGFGVDPAGASASGGHARFKALGAAPHKWLADLPGLARDILTSAGVRRIEGGLWCTVSSPSRFFSFRRDRVTGRQAAGICLR